MKKYPVLVMSALLLASVALADSKAIDRHVTVQGHGKVRAVPDIATLEAEVSQEGASLDGVSAQVKDGMAAVLSVVKKLGVSDRDIQTQAFSVQPKLVYDRAGNSRRAGYRVANRVQIRIHDLTKVGKILTAVVGAGATSVDGPNFDFDNPQQLERQALAAAVEDASAKAKILADAAHATLGAVMTIDQNGMAFPMPRHQTMMSAKLAAAQVAVPVETGDQDFSADVTVSFALQ